MSNTRLIARIVNGEVTEKGDLDEFAVKYHSKDSCRHCHGRGWQYFSVATGSNEIRTCVCVERKLSKALAAEHCLVYTVTAPTAVTKVYYSKTSKKHTEVVEQH